MSHLAVCNAKEKTFLVCSLLVSFSYHVWWICLCFLIPFRPVLHPWSGLLWILCQQGQDSSLQRHHRATVERSQLLKRLLLSYIALFTKLQKSTFYSFFLCRSGVWNRAGGLAVSADPLLREVLRQKHAQQGRQRDRGQDNGERTGPGKRTTRNLPSQKETTHNERCMCLPGEIPDMWLILIGYPLRTVEWFGRGGL